jgi:hypothetical protein
VLRLSDPQLTPGQIEQTKLLANALDRASTACFTIGIATPVAGFIYNVANFGANLDWWRLAAGLLGWLFAALALHYLARRTLKGLDR